jgi:predicted DNA-binding protein
MLSVFRNVVRNNIMQLEINSQIEQSLKVIAMQQGEAIETLAVHILQDYIEDYRDALAAEQAIKRIEEGEDELLDWETVKAGLYVDD